MPGRPSGLRVPHPMVLLGVGVAVAALLSYVIPAGEFARALHPLTKRSIVVPGTFHLVPSTPVGLMAALTAIPRGFIDAADVIAAVFLVGGAFTVVDRTGALRVGLTALVRALGGRTALALPLCCLAFAAAGALENMQEEIIALVPVLVLFAARLGVDRVTAVAMSLGAAAVGAAFSPVNPFQVVIAQQVSDVSVFSGAVFRSLVMSLALATWILGVVRYARRAGRTVVADSMSAASEMDAVPNAAGARALTALRTTIVLGAAVAALGAFIVGLVRFGWGFNELSGVFLAAGVVAGLVGGLGAGGTAEAFGQGFRDMSLAALLIGVARAVYVALADGHIVDTVVHALFTPLASLSPAVAVLGMLAVQSVVHVIVPSVSGQAVLTMPILAPLADLLHISRQVAVLAYQYGAGLCEVITPTNGALMAVLAAAGVPFERWLRFVVPLWGVLLAMGAVALLVAMAIGLS